MQANVSAEVREKCIAVEAAGLYIEYAYASIFHGSSIVYLS
jgi:hypothetical protein